MNRISRRLALTLVGTAALVLAMRVGDTRVAAASTSATFLLTDVATKGDWKGVYGANGEAIANDSFNIPGYATVGLAGFGSWTWSGSTTDVRALRQAASATNRIASTWYADASFTIDVNFTDNASHQVALFVEDWDALGRAETIDVLDGPGGPVLDTRSVAGFGSGQYLKWRVTGHPVFRITRTAGPNAVVSGIFFDSAVGTHTPPTVLLTKPTVGTPFTALAAIDLESSVTPFDGATVSAVKYFSGATQVAQWNGVEPAFRGHWTNVAAGTYSLTAHVTDSLGGATISLPVSITVSPAGGGGAIAAFVQTDVTTQGNWPGAYGADGSTVANDHTTNPLYALVTFAGQLNFTWSMPSSDPRAHVTAANPNARIASTFYSSSNFSIDVNLTDGQTHQIALYLLDWENLGRTETIQVVDANSLSVLDTRSASAFATAGKYLVWTISGHVKFIVTNNKPGANAVVSGIFFDSPLGAPVAASARLLNTDVATSGNWPGVYGAQGYNVVNNQTVYPAYAQVSTLGVPAWTWSGQTSSGRALRKGTNQANPLDRIAAALFSSTNFSIDVNLVDGAAHQIALYLTDFDNAGRTETVDALDAVSGAVLDTQTVTAFGGGKYLVYRAAGHLKFRFSDAGGPNAVLSGIFFDADSTAPPVANAGPNQTVGLGAAVTLNGSGSNDSTNKPLTYAWVFNSRPATSVATLSNPTSVAPTFVADKPGTYVVQLIVNNGTSNSAPDTVTIVSQNTPPVAYAGLDQVVGAGATVTLNGSGSTDAEGNPLTYSWSFVSKPAASTATLTGANTVSPTFVADVAGSYVVQLIVNDGTSSSAPDTVTISRP